MTRRRTPVQATFSPWKLSIATGVVVLAALVPLIYPSVYGTGVMVTMLILITLNASWNFLLGHAGVWNFGQLALYAGGGYGCGMLVLHAGFPPVLGLIGGVLAGALLAVLLAIPTLRLFGIYTSLLTFAASEVVQLVIQNDDTGATGGAFGLPSIPGLFGSLSPLGEVRAWYWLCLAVAVASVTGLALLVRLPFGLALRTMRDSLPYASARGINPMRNRIQAFALSGAIAGVAGGLYTLYNGSIAPNVMGLTPMSIYVTMIVVGGLGTITGPIVGTVVLTIVQQALIDHPGTQLTVLGVILLVIVVFFPRGLAAEAGVLQRRVEAWMNEEEPPPEPVAPEPAPRVATGRS
ncbi:MAG: branched-chain amino acid transport system permease protein [Solirubrobacteraceae bacterium]|nr:branched-chain amino acid transport system permease protein [Solirubrobacteraceae bacterium]